MRDLIGLPIDKAIELIGGRAYRVMSANPIDSEFDKLVVAVREDADYLTIIVSDFKTSVEFSE